MGVNCAEAAETIAVRGTFVSVRTRQGDEQVQLLWSAKTGLITLQNPIEFGLRRFEVSHDGAWLFVIEPTLDNALLEELVAYNLGKPADAPRVISGQVTGSCTGRVIATPAPGTKVLLQSCAAESEGASIVAYDWAADFASTTLLASAARPSSSQARFTTDGRFLLASDSTGALHRVALADGADVTVTGEMRAYVASDDGATVVFRQGNGDVSKWTEKDGASKVLGSATTLGFATPTLSHFFVATATEDHAGETTWKTENVVLVETATGKVLELAGKAGGDISSANFSPDGKTAFYLDSVQALGTGTLYGQRLDAAAPFQVATGVAGWSFTQGNTLLVDAAHEGPTLFGPDSRYTILAVPPGYDGTPTVVAEQAVNGKLQYADRGTFFYAIDAGAEGDGIYRATVP